MQAVKMKIHYIRLMLQDSTGLKAGMHEWPVALQAHNEITYDEQ